MSLETPFQLKHTNVSRPRLSHSDSQQSLAASQAASEGYYSLHSTSEGSSGESDDRSKPTPGRTYHTPPSHHRTPAQSHDNLVQQPEGPPASLKGIGIPRQYPLAGTQLQSSAVSTIAEERPETQEGKNSQLRAGMDSMSPATTPGMDETPYIRFAIDQITRDEEVRGSRTYPLDPPPEEDDYPVERLVSDDGLGYMEHEQGKDRRVSRPAPSKTALPTSNTVNKPSVHDFADPLPVQTLQKDVFVPASLPHSPLGFLPRILRPLWLGMFLLVCLLMLGALVFAAVYSRRHSGIGLWAYTGFGDARYFIFEYLPTILGMFVLMWLFQVQIALQRIVPFISMASGSTQQRSEAPFLELYPMQFLLPKLEHFRAGQPLIGTFYTVSWLFLWSIPLLASSFNVRYDLASREWRWVAVHAIIWPVAALYVLLSVGLLALMAFLMRKETGLRWDPRSLADIISLLERSNITNDYSGSETSTNAEVRQRLGHRTDRIGYWSTTKRPNDIFYGLGEEGGPTRRYSLEDGRIREKGPERAEPPPEVQRPVGDYSIRLDLRSSRLRLRYLPWYLRDSAVVAWVVIAFVLFIAFVVVSYLNSSVRIGFLPQVAARTDQSGFSVSNFVYSFVPAVIGFVLFLAILSLDYSLRALRPYISLSSKGGATAEASLLVDYSARLPLSATVAALENRHFQPAILSFVSLCSAAIPILAGGCFWTQYYPNSDVVRVAADIPAYYALCFFLGLYTVSTVMLIPSRRRAALPHRATSLAETISWVYQSPILTDRAFSRPQTKPELVTRLMGTAYLERTWAQSLTSLIRPSRSDLRGDSPTDPTLTDASNNKEKREAKEAQQAVSAQRRNSVLEPGKIRYGFGIHVGRDGLEHLGIDRVSRGGERSGRELVIWEEQEQRRSWAQSAIGSFGTSNAFDLRRGREN